MSKIQVNDIVNHYDTGAPQFPKGIAVGSGATLGLNVGTGASIYSPSDNVLTLGTNSAERLRITANGDVEARRNRSNTIGDVALSLQPSDSTIHYGFRIDNANNNLNIDKVSGTAANLIAITAVGNFGISTTAPDKKLTVFTDSNSGYSTATNSTPSGQSLIKLFNKNGTDNTGVDNYSAIEFGVANGATSQGWLGYTRTGNNQGAFFVKQRNAASSYPETIRFPSSGGVTFGGGANTANTLDDYEEGTWTPTFQGLTNSTYITLNGNIDTMRYVKVGRKVTIFGRIQISAVNSATGAIQLGGLPFTSDNSGPDQSNFNALQIILHGFSLPANGNGVVFAELQGNATVANIYCVRDNDSWTNLDCNNINTTPGVYLYVTGSFFANS